MLTYINNNNSSYIWINDIWENDNDKVDDGNEEDSKFNLVNKQHLHVITIPI